LCVRLEAAAEISHTIHRTFPWISKGEYCFSGSKKCTLVEGAKI